MRLFSWQAAPVWLLAFAPVGVTIYFGLTSFSQGQKVELITTFVIVASLPLVIIFNYFRLMQRRMDAILEVLEHEVRQRETKTRTGSE